VVVAQKVKRDDCVFASVSFILNISIIFLNSLNFNSMIRIENVNGSGQFVQTDELDYDVKLQDDASERAKALKYAKQLRELQQEMRSEETVNNDPHLMKAAYEALNGNAYTLVPEVNRTYEVTDVRVDIYTPRENGRPYAGKPIVLMSKDGKRRITLEADGKFAVSLLLKIRGEVAMIRVSALAPRAAKHTENGIIINLRDKAPEWFVGKCFTVEAKRQEEVTTRDDTRTYDVYDCAWTTAQNAEKTSEHKQSDETKAETDETSESEATDKGKAKAKAIPQV
jgi:hypothetical protein